MKKVCFVCKRTFTPSKFHPYQKYCSKRCRKKSESLGIQKEVDLTKIKKCIECGKEFHPSKYNKNQNFCSKKCRSRFKARKYPPPEKREPKICGICRKKFIPKKYQPFQKYCSRSCGRKAIDRRYYNKHREEVIKRKKQYFKTPKGKEVLRAHSKRVGYKRRMKTEKLTKLGISLSTQDQIKIRKMFSKCIFCDKNLNEKQKTFDHIIPLNKHGIDHKNNVIIVCRNCNSSKQDKSIVDFCKKLNIPVPQIILKKIESQLSNDEVLEKIRIVDEKLYKSYYGTLKKIKKEAINYNNKFYKKLNFINEKK